MSIFKVFLNLPECLPLISLLKLGFPDLLPLKNWKIERHRTYILLYLFI